MHWVRGILLGLVLTAALPVIQALLIVFHLEEPGNAFLAAVALEMFCLLGVLIFKPGGVARQMRVVRSRGKEDEE